MAAWGHGVDGYNDSPVLAKSPPPSQRLFLMWWCCMVMWCGDHQAGRVLPKASPAMSSKRERPNRLLSAQVEGEWSGITGYFSPPLDSGSSWLYWWSLVVNLSSCMWNVTFQLNFWFQLWVGISGWPGWEKRITFLEVNLI